VTDSNNNIEIFLDHIKEFRNSGNVHVFRVRDNRVDAETWNSACAEANQRFNANFKWFVVLNDNELSVSFEEAANV
jgi:hypothetical protein